MIKIALIGCGGMANSHSQRFAALKGRVQVAAVVDVEIKRAKAVADGLEYPTIVAADYRDVLDAVDAVFLVLPHHLHHPVARECLAKGKHVLVEKPLANTEWECVDLIQLAEKHQRILMVAYPMRYHPMVVQFKQLLDEKVYGDVFQMSMWTEQYTQYPPDHWASSASTLGGGQLFSHGCHYIDLLLWMMGQPTQGCHMGTNHGTPWMEREGTSHIVMKFAGGALGHHFGTWGARGTKLRYSIQAHCTGGMLEADYGTGKITLHRDRGTDVLPATVARDHREFNADRATQQTLFDFGGGKQTDKEILHFADCIENGRQPDTDAVSALHGLRVIWKLYDAEVAGTIADLSDLDGPIERQDLQQAKLAHVDIGSSRS